jgi:2-phosphosulfolactate phosphatase
MSKHKIEVCFSSQAIQYFDISNAHIVVVDILRATSAICAAFANGAKAVIPAPTLDDARIAKDKGYIVAAERDGVKLDFADFGNSPLNFTPEKIANQEIVYSTTNGTQAIILATGWLSVAIGSFINIAAIARWVESKPDGDLLILCAGWKGKFCLEDALFAGALSSILLERLDFYTKCDSTHAAIQLWNNAKTDLTAYLENIAQRHRLKKLGLDNVLDYCFTLNSSNLVPIFCNGKLIATVY